MNDLDFQNRTRTFFSEIRSKYRDKEEMVPIRNPQGHLSTNCSETLKNWSEYYKKLYSSDSVKSKPYVLPTPQGDHPPLDKDLILSEFLDVIYTLENHTSPGFDNILNEDIKSAILEETSDDKVPPQQKIVLLDLFMLSSLTSGSIPVFREISREQCSDLFWKITMMMTQTPQIIDQFPF